MNLSEWSKEILFGENLDSKTLDCDEILFDDEWQAVSLPNLPGRNKKIAMSGKQLKFPRGHFHENEKKAMALHSFANHELLATELMAGVLLKFPHNTPEMKHFSNAKLE